MPTIHGNLTDITNRPTTCKEIWIRANTTHAQNNTLITTEQHRIQTTNGTFTTQCAPGLAVMVLVFEAANAFGTATTETVPLLVTEGASLAEMVEGGRLAAEEDRTVVESLAAQVLANLQRAKQSASAAASSASSAATSAQRAEQKAVEATDRAREAANSAGVASGKAGEATAKAGEAANSALAAKRSQDAAKSSEMAAAASARAAAGSAGAAKASEIAAKASENAAKTSQSAAKASETAAAGSASVATDSAAAAHESAQAAKSSETAAAASEQKASDYAEAATMSSIDAGQEAQNAQASADAARESADSAAWRANEAVSQAGDAAARAQLAQDAAEHAAASAGAAKSSQDAAKASEVAAQAAQTAAKNSEAVAAGAAEAAHASAELASGKATAAASSASSAASNADRAASSANTASSKAAQAAESATSAASSESNAANSAIAAKRSQDAAASSASSAATSAQRAEDAVTTGLADGSVTWRKLATDSINQINTLIRASIDQLVDGAPEALDTLRELAVAIEENQSQSSALLQQINLRIRADEAAKTYATKRELADGLAGKAASSHTHQISHVANLESTLAGKADKGHTHAIENVVGLQAALDAKVSSSDPRLTDARTPKAHEHKSAEITDAKSDNVSNVIVKRDDTGSFKAGVVTARGVSIEVSDSRMNPAVDFKYPGQDGVNKHARIIGYPNENRIRVQSIEDRKYVDLMYFQQKWGVINPNVTFEAETVFKNRTFFLQQISANSGIDSRHNRIINVTDPTVDSDAATKRYVDGEVAKKASARHTHAIADVTGLQNALNGKAASSHTHAIANVTGLQDALNGKVNTNDSRLTNARTPTAHTHPSSQISDATTNFGHTSLVGKVLKLNSYGNIELKSGVGGEPSLFRDGEVVPKKTVAAMIAAAVAGKVNSNDSRLTNARTPTAHTHTISQISDLQNQLNSKATKADITNVRGTESTTPGTNWPYVKKLDECEITIGPVRRNSVINLPFRARIRTEFLIGAVSGDHYALLTVDKGSTRVIHTERMRDGVDYWVTLKYSI